jgi:hypothetical protein
VLTQRKRKLIQSKQIKKCISLFIFKRITDKNLSTMPANPCFMEMGKESKPKVISKSLIKLERRIHEKDIYQKINLLNR